MFLKNNLLEFNLKMFIHDLYIDKILIFQKNSFQLNYFQHYDVLIFYYRIGQYNELLIKFNL